MKTGFGHFLDFGTLNGLDIAYNDSAKCSSTFANGYRSCMIHWLCMISIIYAKRAKNEVFDHLIKFGWFDWSDIAYNDSAKCFWTFGNGYRPCNISLVVHDKHNICKKELKIRFLSFIWSLLFICHHLVPITVWIIC